MCNRARNRGEPETLFERFDASWAQDVVRPNSDPVELFPKSKAYVVREEGGRRVLDVMAWDVLGGQAAWPMTNVRNLALPQWRRPAAEPLNRCLIPLTEFCEWTPDKHKVGEGPPIKGEMWFDVPEQPVFAVAGFWQQTAKGAGFTMVTCDPNDLVAPIHPKAMITILHPDDHEQWLTGGYDDIVTLQRPYPAEQMTVRGPVFPTRTGF
ncbi:SOS response-associated peptidase family protein [Sphingomonas sp. CFBP 8765]|uniref:SOS response-associated peptidase family protein n=1 Tax=Sphingomonas sp. CFBP 8765 TaxID=2775274 RepID=UPI0017828290|nr:SOS response-associated peptidase family protein [Sphingomonas sp. CFBP 8765]MBD8469422.1 SOS response-associated peptidase family protein [Sphingomonas sp. CFBP 8765]